MAKGLPAIHWGMAFAGCEAQCCGYGRNELLVPTPLQFPCLNTYSTTTLLTWAYQVLPFLYPVSAQFGVRKGAEQNCITPVL